MNNTVLDVLIYLFEHYTDEENDVAVDEDSLRNELSESGFQEKHIGQAFEWLQDLAIQQTTTDIRDLRAQGAFRILTDDERGRLDLESQGFLIFLEQIGVVNHKTRELILDRVMALETDLIEMDQLKWIVLMVLFNQPGEEEAFGWMEDLVMDEHRGSIH